jgi:hypothetical protein
MRSTLVRKKAARLLLGKQDHGFMTFCGLRTPIKSLRALG